MYVQTFVDYQCVHKNNKTTCWGPSVVLWVTCFYASLRKGMHLLTRAHFTKFVPFFGYCTSRKIRSSHLQKLVFRFTAAIQCLLWSIVFLKIHKIAHLLSKIPNLVKSCLKRFVAKCLQVSRKRHLKVRQMLCKVEIKRGVQGEVQGNKALGRESIKARSHHYGYSPYLHECQQV